MSEPLRSCVLSVLLSCSPFMYCAKLDVANNTPINAIKNIINSIFSTTFQQMLMSVKLIYFVGLNGLDSRFEIEELQNIPMAIEAIRIKDNVGFIHNQGPPDPNPRDVPTEPVYQHF